MEIKNAPLHPKQPIQAQSTVLAWRAQWYTQPAQHRGCDVKTALLCRWVCTKEAGRDGMGCDGMGCQGMPWDRMRWNGTGWDGLEWDGMRCNTMQCGALPWDVMLWDGIRRHAVEWDGVRWFGMGSCGMRCDAMQWNEKGRHGMPQDVCLSLQKHARVDMSSSTAVEWRPNPEIFRRCTAESTGRAGSAHSLPAHTAFSSYKTHVKWSRNSLAFCAYAGTDRLQSDPNTAPLLVEFPLLLFNLNGSLITALIFKSSVLLCHINEYSLSLESAYMHFFTCVSKGIDASWMQYYLISACPQHQNNIKTY